MSYGPFGWELQRQSECRKHPRLKGVQLPERNILACLPPRIRETVKFYSEKLGVEPGAVLLYVLAASRFSIQGVANVEAPGGWKLPTSGMFLIILPSGGKKSVIEREIFNRLRELEEELLSTQFGEEFKSSESKRPLIFLKRITNAALLKMLKKVGSCALIYTESGALFKKWDEDEIATINEVHDGDSLSDARDGANAQNFKHVGARLTVLLGLPYKAFMKFIKTSKGEYWLDSGAFNRFTIYAQAEGTETPEGNPYLPKPQEVEEFHAQLESLLKQAHMPEAELKQYSFDQQAKDYDKHLQREVRELTQPGGYLKSVKERGDKLMDEVYRNAIIFHLSCGNDGDISAETLHSAYLTTLYFTDYHVAMFTDYPQYFIDAKEVDFDYLQPMKAHPFSQTPEGCYMPLDVFKRYLPLSMRKGDRFDQLMACLVANGKIATWKGRTRNKGRLKTYVELFPGENRRVPGWLTLGEAVFW